MSDDLGWWWPGILNKRPLGLTGPLSNDLHDLYDTHDLHDMIYDTQPNEYPMTLV